MYGADDDAAGFAVVATSVKEAKKIVWTSGELNTLWADVAWVDMRALWQRDADVDDLPIGMVNDPRVGLLHGIYGYLEEYPCDVCESEVMVYAHNGRVLCEGCIENERLKLSKR